VSACVCRALTEVVCSNDPEEESRIRRLAGGIQIECWRRVAKIIVPDDLPPGPNDVGMVDLTPDQLRHDECLELPLTSPEQLEQ
jgi:hypothetical protein